MDQPRSATVFDNKDIYFLIIEKYQHEVIL